MKAPPPLNGWHSVCYAKIHAAMMKRRPVTACLEDSCDGSALLEGRGGCEVLVCVVACALSQLSRPVLIHDTKGDQKTYMQQSVNGKHNLQARPASVCKPLPSDKCDSFPSAAISS
eukprot:TRINITY_DN34219_c0_g1_i2.p3 TRINITY_DN34219_c0_g1~~TRINITY_DN34219_c0_g1_i2.p3  ORF type:complete len:116 (+),score=15.55 TRINITY_DN34219_c0_g1_i2:518-865(+)